jgi:hypothetical protein
MDTGPCGISFETDVNLVTDTAGFLALWNYILLMDFDRKNRLGKTLKFLSCS